MGSPQDSTWRDFPQALMEIQGARHYVTLFEAPFLASELGGHESHALMAGSLLAIPPPPPGSQPLPGAPLADLTGQNLAQWADKVQEALGLYCGDLCSVVDRKAGLFLRDIVSALNSKNAFTPFNFT